MLNYITLSQAQVSVESERTMKEMGGKDRVFLLRSFDRPSLIVIHHMVKHRMGLIQRILYVTRNLGFING